MRCSSLSCSVQHSAARAMLDKLDGPLPPNKRLIEVQTDNQELSGLGALIQASTITQVFHISAEERKGSDQLSGDINKKLTSIEATTGAKIQVSSSEDKSLTFLITGKGDTVMKAKREILQRFQQEGSATINIPKEHHRFLLEKGGVKLQDLEKQTSTVITVPKAGDNSDRITVQGNREGIPFALLEIKNISSGDEAQANIGLAQKKVYEETNWLVNESVSCPTWLHKFIIGRKGAGIQKISQELQKVHIGFYDDDTIKLDGPPHQVEKAKAELKSWIIELSWGSGSAKTSADHLIFEKKCKSQVFLNGALKISRTTFEDHFRFSARVARNQEYDEVSNFLSRKMSMVCSYLNIVY